MQTAVVVALIASLTSVAVAGVNTYWTYRQQRDERANTAKEKLDRYREPLLSAVDDLGNRVNNIRHHGFLSYLDTDRSRLTLLGTAFRLAQFFGWVEVVYGASGYLRLAADKRTAGVANMIGWVSATIANDKFDRVQQSAASTSRLLLWREQQRAIGELMRDSADPSRIIGFSKFADEFEDKFSPWFGPFLSDLALETDWESHWAATSARLERAHALLACLLTQLDVDNVLVRYTSSGELDPRWIRDDGFRTVEGAEFVLPRGSKERS